TSDAPSTISATSGATAANAPKAVATPRPPRKPVKAGDTCPKTAAAPATAPAAGAPKTNPPAGPAPKPVSPSAAATSTSRRQRPRGWLVEDEAADRDGANALQHVARDHEHRPAPAHRPEGVGNPGLARSVLADIAEAREAPEQHTEGEASQQVPNCPREQRAN